MAAFSTRIPNPASRLLWATLFVVSGTLTLAGVATAQDYRSRSYVTDDFGPSPFDSSYDDQGLSPTKPFAPSTRGSSRYEDRGTSGSRSRDPAALPVRNYGRELFGEEFDRNYAPRDDFRPDFGHVAPREGRPGRSYESRYAPEDRNFQFDDLPRGPRVQPAPRNPAPNASKPAEPTLSEKIAKRYQDPRVIRIVQQINSQAGEALYAEISQLIDSRHITPTSYQQRVESALEHLATAIQTPSFQEAVGISSDPQATRWVRQQLQGLAAQQQAQNLQQAVGVMREAGNVMAQAYNVNPAVVSLEFVYGALDTLDKFSMFVAPEKSGETSLGLKENMVGIGVEIEAHPQGLKILKTLTGGPAAVATLKRGDIITAVDGHPTAGIDLNQAVDYIAGAAGSSVKLDLRRDNMIGEVTLVRRPFTVQSVSEVRMEQAGVGYIKLDQFAESSAKEMDAALWKLHNEGMQSLIIDLRGNPGGLLTTAISLSDMFLPSGTIVSTKGRTMNDNSEESAQYANTWKMPLVVLVDHNSASASEIFAAAIQENDRGVLVGEKSYGKGTVQTLFPLKSVPSALRLTTAKFYSPDGREMAGQGVTPDIKVTSMKPNADPEDDAALKAAINAALDPRVMDMAGKFRNGERTGLRVIRVAI